MRGESESEPSTLDEALEQSGLPSEDKAILRAAEKRAGSGIVEPSTMKKRRNSNKDVVPVRGQLSGNPRSRNRADDDTDREDERM